MQRNYYFLTSCVNSTATLINEMVDKSKEVTKRTFLSHAILDDVTREDMHKFPNDYKFYKSVYSGFKCYYYEHSCIEYVFAKVGA